MSDAAWTYEIERTKCRELATALGANPGVLEIQPGMVFAYAVVPAVAFVLTRPEVSLHRGSMRLARMRATLPSALRVGSELRWRYVEDRGHPGTWHFVGDGDDGSLSLGFGTTGLSSFTESEPRAEISFDVDTIRSVAFAAATWDLNPAYWDEGFAQAAGLGAPVAPPGLLPSWAASQAGHWIGPVRVMDIAFGRSPRHGESIRSRFFGSGERPETIAFEMSAPDGSIVCTGSVGRARRGILSGRTAGL